MFLSVIFFAGRSPHGERGLKLDYPVFKLNYDSRSPHGERGLKPAWLGAIGIYYGVALLTESVD